MACEPKVPRSEGGVSEQLYKARATLQSVTLQGQSARATLQSQSDFTKRDSQSQSDFTKRQSQHKTAVQGEGVRAGGAAQRGGRVRATLPSQADFTNRYTTQLERQSDFTKTGRLYNA